MKRSALATIAAVTGMVAMSAPTAPTPISANPSTVETAVATPRQRPPKPLLVSDPVMLVKQMSPGFGFGFASHADRFRKNQRQYRKHCRSNRWIYGSKKFRK